ncbi:Mitochondrial protein import protein ZIM17 [Meyerozyma sp. JA9]|nr:Mitochondrial protein import protein ZIM17 [Meyerozyma sp. JA9]
MLRTAGRVALLAAKSGPIRPNLPYVRSPQLISKLPSFHRWNSSQTAKVEQQYMIAFTCKKCNTRSSHTFSKQAYTKGTVAIQCPGCKNRHLIADNLGVFKDHRINIEDLLKAKGESVATGTEDLVFEDIPESLKKTIGHYAKDAPEEFRRDDEDKVHYLEESKDQSKEKK